MSNFKIEMKEFGSQWKDTSLEYFLTCVRITLKNEKFLGFSKKDKPFNYSTEKEALEILQSGEIVKTPIPEFRLKLA